MRAMPVMRTVAVSTTVARIATALLALVVAAALTGCRGDAAKCEQACRNYATLMYWKKVEEELARTPPEQRDAVRKTREGRFDSDLENGLPLCISQCQSANHDDDIACWTAAKTAEQVLACTQ